MKHRHTVAHSYTRARCATAHKSGTAARRRPSRPSRVPCRAHVARAIAAYHVRVLLRLHHRDVEQLDVEELCQPSPQAYACTRACGVLRSRARPTLIAHPVCVPVTQARFRARKHLVGRRTSPHPPTDPHIPPRYTRAPTHARRTPPLQTYLIHGLERPVDTATHDATPCQKLVLVARSHSSACVTTY